MSLKTILKSRIWQDWVFLVGTIFFDVSAIFSLLNHLTLVPIYSSLANFTVCSVLAYTESTVGLKLSSIATYINGFIWLLIAIYRH